MCGKLFCHDGQANPNYGRMVRFGNCKASFYDDHTQDYGQVDAGTKCGDGKVTGGGGEGAEPELTGGVVSPAGVQPEPVRGAEDGLRQHQLLSQVLRSRCEFRRQQPQRRHF